MRRRLRWKSATPAMMTKARRKRTPESSSGGACSTPILAATGNDPQTRTRARNVQSVMMRACLRVACIENTCGFQKTRASTLSDQYTPAKAPAPTYLLSNQLFYFAQKLGRPRACILNHTMLYCCRQPARVAQWQSSALLMQRLEVRVLSRAFI